MFVDINIGTVALAILVVLILILIVSNIQICLLYTSRCV